MVDVFAFGRLDDGRLYLVMDLVDGEPLRARARRRRAARSPTRSRILAPIADALDAAHARGVVHRDLKPDNIMMSDAATAVFVLDFGIAKLVARRRRERSGTGTLTGAARGSARRRTWRPSNGAPTARRRRRIATRSA